jgi:cystathionine beta-lyase
VIHSATKYLGGHSDICAGVVVASESIIAQVFESAKNLGGSLSDYTVWLLERSIKRFMFECKHKMKMHLLSNFLQEQDWIEHVYYPGLENHVGHQIAKRQMHGFGGMLSFNLAQGIDSKQFY